MNTPELKPGLNPGQIACNWWRENITCESGACRAARAKLRRAATPAEALAIPEPHRLYAALNKKVAPDTLALIATSLAWIEKHESSKNSIAEAFGRKTGDVRALSELRFQRLIRTETPAGLIPPLRRALTVVKKTADVARLAADLFYWDERTRTKWCFDYYGAPAAAPATPEEDTDS